MEQKSIFRKKSLERISSPEQLDEYIRVSNPGVWFILIAVIIFLIGIGVWTVFGNIETSITVCAVSSEGNTVCYIRDADKSTCEEGMSVSINGEETVLGKISSRPEVVDGDFEEYALHVGNLIAGEWVYSAPLAVSLPDGIYSAEIITESINPVSFIIN